MADTLRNQLLIPKTGMRFHFESGSGKRYEIYIISADHVSVYFQYLHNDQRQEVSMDQWQNGILAPDNISRVLEVSR